MDLHEGDSTITGNPDHGYHGEVRRIFGTRGAGERYDALHNRVRTLLGVKHDEAKHFLDSRSGRFVADQIHSGEHDVHPAARDNIIRKHFAHFKKTYDPKQFEESVEELNEFLLNPVTMAGRKLKSSGWKQTDHDVTLGTTSARFDHPKKGRIHLFHDEETPAKEMDWVHVDRNNYDTVHGRGKGHASLKKHLKKIPRGGFKEAMDIVSKLIEGRGRPRKDGTKDNTDRIGIHAALLKHKDQGALGHGEVTFANGEKVKISPEERDAALHRIHNVIYSNLHRPKVHEYIQKLDSSAAAFRKAMQESVEDFNKIFDESLDYEDKQRQKERDKERRSERDKKAAAHDPEKVEEDKLEYSKEHVETDPEYVDMKVISEGFSDSVKLTPGHLQSMTPDDVMQVYRGRSEGCRCGCKGTYKVNPKHREAADKDRGYPHEDKDMSHKTVANVLDLIKRHSNEAEYDHGNINYHNEGKPVTLYTHPGYGLGSGKTHKESYELSESKVPSVGFTALASKDGEKYGWHTHTPDEDSKRAKFLERATKEHADLLAKHRDEAYRIGGSFRGPGIHSELKKRYSKNLRESIEVLDEEAINEDRLNKFFDAILTAHSKHPHLHHFYDPPSFIGGVEGKKHYIGLNHGIGGGLEVSHSLPTVGSAIGKGEYSRKFKNHDEAIAHFHHLVDKHAHELDESTTHKESVQLSVDTQRLRIPDLEASILDVVSERRNVREERRLKDWLERNGRNSK